MASSTTPGADNFSEQAAGGIAGIALGVADAHARESGLEALRHTPGYHQPYDDPGARDYGPTGGLDLHDIPTYGAYESLRPSSMPGVSQSSLTPPNAAAMPPPSRSPHSFQGPYYSDNPYNRLSRNMDPAMGGFDPNSIEDDGDDGLEYTHHNRGSIQNLTSNSERSNPASTGGAAAAGGVMGALGGLVGRSVTGNSQYGPVSNFQTGYGDSGYNLGRAAEKSEWLEDQSSSRKRWKWIIASTAIFLIVAGIVAGVTVPLLRKNSSSSSTSGSQTANGDTAANGDLGINSPEIQALMNNTNLHKVFPGIDYSPINTQYPDCLTFSPSQNNVTRDLAVLSQLTNVVRLYGTDCNQTQMLLHSIDRLELNGTVKVWLGVYLDNNATTNARQLAQMYEILSTYETSPFLGVIIGNEVLFNQYMTESALQTVLTEVKSNFTSMGIDLPVATSDLGNNWSAALASAVDYVMANVHPFFSGVNVSIAASWTWDFWQQYDAGFKTNAAQNIISETGWPSQGGTDCGAATSCTGGSVAGIAEMNTFMNDWVCQALANGTNYFWFEAFDEPWKIQFDTATENWEDHWGLMDVNRNLKSGVTIPDCGGKTVGPATA
jgi:exo-beta-1,3-glucanase (GH17 family)